MEPRGRGILKKLPTHTAIQRLNSYNPGDERHPETRLCQQSKMEDHQLETYRHAICSTASIAGWAGRSALGVARDMLRGRYS
jgi:hypothetical protein